MAQEKPNRMAEWVVVVRNRMPVLRHRFGDWVEAVRAEPVLIWQTPAVRYSAYAAGGVVGAWLVVTVASVFLLAPPPGAEPQAVSADFHVLCTNPDCATHFVIHRAFGFDAFPVECPTCRRASGVRAERCHFPACGGRWVAPVERDGVPVCPHCGEPMD